MFTSNFKLNGNFKLTKGEAMKKLSSFLAVFILLCTFGARDSFAIDPPTQQAKQIGFSSVQYNQATPSWVNGNGAKRIVVISTSAIADTPTDDYEYTDVDGDLSDGTIETIGTGVYVVDVLTGSDDETTITGLSENTLYYVRVFEYARNGDGTEVAYNTSTAAYNPSTFETRYEVGTPITLSATGITYYSATVRWGDVTDMPNIADSENHYLLDVKKVSDGTMVLEDYIVGANQNGTSPQEWLVSSLEDATQYQFRVKAKIENIEGAWSNWRSFTTLTSTIPTVTSITTTDEWLTTDTYNADDDTETSFTVYFDQTMNTAVVPSLAFTPDVSSKVTFDYGAWSTTTNTNDTWTGYYDVALNAGDEEKDIDVTVTGAENLAGDANTSYTENDLFNIDNKPPTLLEYTFTRTGNAVEHIKDGDEITVYAKFSEPIDGTPVEDVVINVDFSTDAGGSDTDMPLVRLGPTTPDEYRFIGDVAQLGTNTGLNGYIYLDDFTIGTDIAGNEIVHPTSGYTLYIDNEAPYLDGDMDEDLSITSPATDAAGIELQSLTSIEGSATDTPDGEVALVQVAIIKDTNGDGNNDSGEKYFNGSSFTGANTTGGTPANGNANWLDANNTGLWNYPVNVTLPDGDYVLYVKVIDKAGNTSIDGTAFVEPATGTTERSRAFTIDNIAPETLLIANPVDDSRVSDATALSFDGTVAETNTLESVEYVVYNDANANGSYDAGEYIYDPTSNAFVSATSLTWNDVDNFANGTPGSWDVNTEFAGSIDAAMNLLASGTTEYFEFCVRASDKVGNMTAPVCHTVIIDNEVPTGYLTYTDGSGATLTEVKDGTSVIITAQFDEDMSDDVDLTDGNSYVTAGPAMTQDTDLSKFTLTQSTWTGDGNVDNTFTDGTDVAGNAVTAIPTSGRYDLIIDNTPPETFINSPADGVYLTSAPTIQGTINETNTINNVYYRINGTGIGITTGRTFNNLAATYSIDLSVNANVQNDGTYTIETWSKDLAGNEESPATNQITFTIDGTAPVITIDTPTDNDLMTSFPLFEGSVTEDNLDLVDVTIKKLTNENGDIINLYWNDVLGTFSASSPYWNEATSATVPNWEYDDQTALDAHDTNIDGTYEITARATDLAGNTHSETHSFTIDNTPPYAVSVVRTDPTPTANPHLTNQSTVQFTITMSEEIKPITISDIDPGAFMGTATPDAMNVSVNTTDNIVFTVDIPLLSDGTVYLELDHTDTDWNIEDLAGNALDATAPTLTSLVYDYDGTQPSIDGFVRHDPAPSDAYAMLTNDNTLQFRLTTTEDVINVDASDFVAKDSTDQLAIDNGSITSVTGSGDEYIITVTMANDENVYLEINSSNDIQDLYGNSFTFVPPVVPSPPLPYSSGWNTDQYTSSYNYDGTAPVPTITSQVTDDLTNGTTVSWNVSWNEAVSSFTSTDVDFNTTNIASGYSVGVAAHGTLPNTYVVTLTGIVLTDDNIDGTIEIRTLAGVEDLAGNPSAATAYQEEITIDHGAPEVVSITRINPTATTDPQIISQVDAYFLVEFTEEVVDVDADDFAINQTNPITPQLVTKIDVIATDALGVANYGTSSASVYWLIQVEFVGDATASITIDPTDPALAITDEATNDLGGSAVTSLRYRYDQTAPYIVTYINQNPTYVTNPTYTNLASVNYRVQFNEPVDNVDASDFTWSGTSTGASLGTVTNESGDYIYNIPVTFGAEGTVSVQLDGTDDIVDRATPPNTLEASSYALTSGEYVYDNTDPVVTIDNSDTYVNASSTGIITGGVTEDNPLASFYSGTTVNDVEVQLYNGTQYWDGSSWVGSVTWIDITSNVTDPGTTYDYDWTYTLPTLTDGLTYDVNVRSTDAAGNTSSLETYSFTYDVTPPVPTMDNIDEYVNFVPTPQGDITEAVAMGTAEVLITDGVNYWDGSAWTTTVTWLSVDITGASSPYDWTYNGTLPTLTDGESYQYTVRATDAAGNESASPSPAAAYEIFTYDVTDPVVDITNTASCYNTAPSIMGGITEANIDVLEYRVNSGSWTPATVLPADVFSIPLSGLSNGVVYNVDVRVTDLAGNMDTDMYSFTFDNSNPTVTIDAIDDELNSISTITGTMNDAETWVGIPVVTLTQGATSYTPTVSTPTATTWSVDVSGISFTEGTWDVSVEVQDCPGNTGTDSDSFIYDVTAPTITINTITSPTNTEPTITGTYTETNTITQIHLQVTDGSTTIDVYDNAPSGGTWSLPVTGLTDGTWNVTVVGTDEAGNTTSPAATSSFVYDVTNPTVVSLDPASDENIGGSLPFDVVFTVEFSEIISTFDYTINPTGLTVGTVTPITIDGGYTWEVTVEITAGSDGDKVNLSVDNTTEDLAGNTFTGSASTADYIIDVTPPTALFSRDDVTPTNATSVSWTVEWSEEVTNFGKGETIEPTFTISGVTYTDYTVNSTDDITYTVEVTGISGDGTISINVASGVTDLFNNSSTVTYTNQQEYEIDQTAPEVTNTFPADLATSVNPFDPIVITFSEDMYDDLAADLDGSTDGTMVTVVGQDDGIFTNYSVDWDNDGSSTTLTITPNGSDYFPDGQVVTVTLLDDELYDVANNELVRSNSYIDAGAFIFTTTNIPDAAENYIVVRKLQNLVQLSWENGADSDGNILWGNEDPDTDDSMDESTLNPTSPNSIFGNGTPDEDGQYYALFKGPQEAVLVTGLQAGTKYKMRLYSYIGSTINPNEESVVFTTYSKEEDAFEVVAGVQGLSIGNLYPNPVRDQFSFNFDLTDGSDVKVEIVNTLGNVVAVPVNNQYYGRGVHNMTVSVSSDNIAAGTYFLRVTANGQQVIRPLTVVR
jgi:hypothetical protein